MIRCLLGAGLLLVALQGIARGGRNADGALTVHTNNAYNYSASTVCTATEGDPGTCQAATTTATRASGQVVWLLAAFGATSDPGVAVIYFGIDYDDVNLDPGAAYKFCGPGGTLEVPDGDWPYGGRGNSVAFGSPVTGDHLFPFYVFKIDGGVTGSFFRTGINPTGGYAAFVDNGSPPELDPCVRFGEIRWNEAGQNDCPPSPQPEACCFVSGTCTFVPGAECTASGGTAQGPGTLCNPNPCPQPQACCDASGTCTFVQVGVCVAGGGTPQGPGSSCTPNPCPQPGACCFADGSCTFALPAACQQSGGAYQGPGGSCNPNPCPQPPEGACCVGSGACSVLTQTACGGAGGTYQGDNTGCDPNPCPQACCFANGVCAMRTPGDCTSQQGQLHGGIDCDPTPCSPPRSCCLPGGTCQSIAPEFCTAQGGTPGGEGSTCDPNPCPIACCLPTGVCEMRSDVQCTSADGTSMGEGTPCEPDPCTVLEACCFEDGACSLVQPGVCAGAGGQSQGAGTVCEPNACPLTGPGACCFVTGSCQVLARDACLAQQGDYIGQGSPCDPNPCAHSDLVIFSITPSASPYGQAVVLQVTVKNQGTRDAGASKACLRVDGVMICAEIAVGPLAPGATEQVVCDAGNQGVGSHEIVACADCTNLIAEEAEGNNCLPAQLVVTAPDLVVEALSPGSALPGQPIIVTVTIKNDGDQAAGPSSARVAVDGGAACAVLATPGIPAGESRDVTCNIGALPCGSHTLDACADVLTEVLESDEGNNCRTSALAVTAPDLIVERIDPDQALAEQPVTATVTLKNQGSADAPASKLRVSVDGNVKCDAADVPPIPRGQTAQISCSIGSYPEGEVVVSACADPAGLVTECDEINNCTEETILLKDLPDLVVVQISPDIANLGLDVTAAITIRNDGSREAGVSVTRLRMDNAVICDAIDTPALAPGAEAVLYCPLGGLACGTYALQACADVTGAVAEFSETNNCRTEPLSIYGVDLVIDSILPDEAGAGDPVTVTAFVRNQGLADAASTKTRVRVNGEDLCGEIDIPAIRSGETASVTCAIGSYDQSTIQVEACADVTGVLAECDETNDCRTEAIDIVPTAIGLESFTASSGLDGVTLEWEIPQGVSYAGFHLYRRAGPFGESTRLTASPIPSRPGVEMYAWRDEDVSDGDEYTYTLMGITWAGREERLGNLRITVVSRADSTDFLTCQPDPFSVRIVFTFEVPAVGDVTLEIYDAAGRRVHVLAEGERSPGVTTAAWWGEDDLGRVLPSGPYFARLASAGSLIVRRITLVR